MSNSREKILSLIKSNKPEYRPLPEIPLFEQKELDMISAFSKMVATSGGSVIRLASGETLDDAQKVFLSGHSKIISTTDKIPGNTTWSKHANPGLLDGIDLAIMEGELGVAENGAIWISEGNMGTRVLPFITQHLMVLLNEKNLVGNMAQAYQKIQIDREGFGLFIAGPSKTADIEQSLVIGAQGARSFTVIII